MQRGSGIILHPTSLPGAGGIGTLGATARDFIDFLADSEQQHWQMLPLGPTGLGNSPYMATSAFAGNPLLIDLLELSDRGWLVDEIVDNAPASSNEVDFGAVIAHKFPALVAAHAGFVANASGAERASYVSFKDTHASWLDDFALFTALGRAHGDTEWQSWPAGLRDREATALQRAREDYAEGIEQVCFEQFCFFRQWAAVRAYARAHGIKIIGDLPIFMAANSADVWAHRELFFLDAEGHPSVVAGVPPDYFSATGQLWGNPLYRWDVLEARGFDWWIARFEATLRMVDVVRVDHFRGFAAYWEVAAGSEDATGGRWVKGPGKPFFDRLAAALGELPIIAEDLGEITDDVLALRDGVGLPGMKVLQFAFGDYSNNLHLPHLHVAHSVVYSGTHDNETTAGWYAGLNPQIADHVRLYLSIDGHDIAWQMLSAAWRSVANLAMVPAQDLLSLTNDCRMNTPGVADGNWAWRLRDEDLHLGAAMRLRTLTRRYGRSAVTSARE